MNSRTCNNWSCNNPPNDSMSRHGSSKYHALSACRCVTTLLEADSRLLIRRTALRESKKHDRDAWFLFSNALMSTHWALRRVTDLPRNYLDLPLPSTRVDLEVRIRFILFRSVFINSLFKSVIIKLPSSHFLIYPKPLILFLRKTFEYFRSYKSSRF